MKKRYLIATAFLTVGVSIPAEAAEAAELPNPNVGECVIADVVVTRTEPTMIDPDGEIVGLRIYQACGFQYPSGTGGYTAKDDVFVTDIDVDDAELIAAAASELVAD